MITQFPECEQNHRAAINWLTKAAIALDEWDRDHLYSDRPAGKAGVKITAADLRRANACYAGCKQFRRTWPRGLVITLPMVPILLASGHMAPHATTFACLVARTPHNLMKVADYLRNANRLLAEAIPLDRSARLAAITNANDISASVAVRRAAEEATVTRDGARHIPAVATLRRSVAAACRAYEAERAREAERAVTAIVAEWRDKTASAREWLDRLNSDWWRAWARDLLERKAR